MRRYVLSILFLVVWQAMLPAQSVGPSGLPIAAQADVLAAGPAAASAQRVVIIDIDGLRRDVFETSYRAGRLKNLQRLFEQTGTGTSFTRAVYFKNARTIFPTVTFAAQASIFTGVHPQVHGIAGNRWFDRSAGKLIDYLSATSVSCVYTIGSGCSAGLANQYLQVPTIYEVAAQASKRSVVVFSQYWQSAGAARDSRITTVLPSATSLLNFGRAELFGDTGAYAGFDAVMVKAAIEAINAGLPDILTIYFTGLDATSHEDGTRSQSGYLENTVDKLVGSVLDAIQQRESNWRETALFVVAADHGHTDPDVRESIGGTVDNAIKSAGYSSGQYALAWNYGMVHIYLRNRGGNYPWQQPPRFKEDVMAVTDRLAVATSLVPLTWEIVVRGADGHYAVYASGGSTTPLAATTKHELIEALECDRSGDILVLFKPKVYSTLSEHGSIHDDDLSIPIVVAGPNISGAERSDQVGTVNLARTIAQYLGFAAETRMQPALPGIFRPAVNAGGTVNVASFVTPLAGGSVAAMFGSNLALGVAVASGVPLPTTLDGVTVQVNGVAAPLFFVSPSQINFQFPWQQGGSQATITVTVSGLVSASQTVATAAYAPAIFSTNQQGTGQGAILISSSGELAAAAGSVPGSAARPAKRGEFVSIYCTGLGPVGNPPPDGMPAGGNPPSRTTALVSVTIGGRPAVVDFAGLAPGFVALYQVNAQIPADAQAGNAVSVSLQVGNAVSNTVTIAVQ